MRKCFILSIDGGGIRGIIPSIFLASLKENLQKININEPFHQIFDLMAGTSTGGLIALALSVPLFKKTDGDMYDLNGGIQAQKLPFLYETCLLYTSTSDEAWVSIRKGRLYVVVSKD